MGIAGRDLTTNQQINSLTFTKKVNTSFSKYLISVTKNEHEKLSNCNVVSIINSETQKKIRLPIPLIKEQKLIAEFLDKKTALIDEAVAIKKKQIELLKERRQIMIQNAVTRGLDPNVPMKDSGVDWIGEIPAHWEIMVNRNLFSERVEPGKTGDDESIMQDPFNPNEINITSKPDTLRNLIERLKHDEIDLNTEFQRHADLWDNGKMSRLIESILIRFPLPALYFDASEEENWLVVDGLQRLSSIKKFIIDKKLKLHGLEYLKELNGAGYDDLPRTYTRRIDECPVTLFLIQPGTPEKVKYSIFRRINTGGLILNDQEIRNAMTTPEVRNFLSELSEDAYLKKTIGDQSRRMIDQEFILRFLAFHYMDYSKTKKNITVFLDEKIDKLTKSSENELLYFKVTFSKAVKRCWDIFGDYAFEKRTRGQTKRRRRKNSTLFEVWTTTLVTLSDEQMSLIEQKKTELIKRHEDLVTDDNNYFRAITYSTQKKEHFSTRNEKVSQIIKEILNA